MQHELIKQIQTVLEKYDSLSLRTMIESIPLRRAAVAAIKRDSFAGKYASLELSHARIIAAGGKSWYRILRIASQSVIETTLTKQEAAKAASRNAEFIAKIKKACVVRIDSSTVLTDSDTNYTACWKVITQKGSRTARLDVVFVSGTNVRYPYYKITFKLRS